jgi:glycerate-2-kinase
MLFENAEKVLEGGAYKEDRRVLIEVLSGFVKGADAYAAVRRAVRRDEDRIRVGNRFLSTEPLKEVAFLAAGNAAGAMASAFVDALGDLVTQGILISPDEPPRELPFIRKEVREPLLPSPQGVEAASLALELVQGLGKGDLLVPLLSPGSLGMLGLPPTEMDMDSYRALILSALNSNVPPSEFIAMIRGLSRTQGGRLVENVQGVAVETLVVERGEGGDMVGAGPATPPPPGNGLVARKVLEDIEWWGKLPKGLQDRVLAPPSPPRSYSDSPKTVVVAGPADALDMAGAEAGSHHHKPKLIALHDEGRPAEAATRLMAGLEKEVQANRDPRSKGVSVFSGLTLGTLEGAERSTILEAFLKGAGDRIDRRGVTVAAMYTGGSLRSETTPSAGMVDGTHLPTMMDLRKGFTDVGFMAVAWCSTDEERGGAPPKVSKGKKGEG